MLGGRSSTLNNSSGFASIRNPVQYLIPVDVVEIKLVGDVRLLVGEPCLQRVVVRRLQIAPADQPTPMAGSC